MTSIILTGCSYFQSEEIDNTGKIYRDVTPIPEVEIFQPDTDRIELVISKNGTVYSENIVQITPEITGRIGQIEVKVGQSVREGDILLKLGDSLSTNLLDLQKETAQKTQNLAKSNQQVTAILAQEQTDAAAIGVKIAWNNYLNSITSFQDSKNVFYDQYENGLIELDNAEIAYQIAKNNSDNTQDTVEDLEDELDDLEDGIDDLEDLEESPEIKSQITALKQAKNDLEIALNQAENTIDNAEYNEDLADNRLEQGEIAINSLKTNYKSQSDQLTTAIKQSLAQYELAINQLESTQAATELQQIGAEMQVLQAQTNLTAAELNQANKTIKAPISGIVTQISAQEGNLAMPGQSLLTIENDKALIVKVSLNQDETKLIKLNDKVLIESDTQNTYGYISSISPTLNQLSKKIEIEIALHNSAQLTPQSFVTAHFTISQSKNIFLPLTSILPLENKKFVRIIDYKNRIKLIEVSIGKIIGNSIEITNGLTGDEKIILINNNFLEEGQKVKIKQ